jgi:hypothetical protein
MFTIVLTGTAGYKFCDKGTYPTKTKNYKANKGHSKEATNTT